MEPNTPDINEQVEKIIPKQKLIDQRNFLQRNKKLIIIIGLVLLIMFIAVNIYVNYGLNYAYKKLY